MHLYADDTCIVYCGQYSDETKTKVETDLVKLSKWLNDHKPTLNTDKSCFSIILKKEKLHYLNLTIATKSLRKVDCLNCEMSYKLL